MPSETVEYATRQEVSNLLEEIRQLSGGIARRRETIIPSAAAPPDGHTGRD